MKTFCGMLLLALAAAAPAAHGQSLETPLVSRAAAERGGLVRAWAAQLPLDPARTKVKSLTLESGLLLALTDDFMLHAVEPETGLIIWSSQFGDRPMATLPPAANETLVAVVSGTTLYLLDRSNGNVITTHPTGGTPDAAPVLAGGRVVVPLMRGPLEVHLLERKKEGVTLMRYLPGLGRMIGRPEAVGSTVLWTGDRDRLDSHQFADFGIEFSLRIPGEVSTGPMAFAPNVYLGTKAGYVLAFELRRGEKVWEFAAGSPVVHPPIPLGETVYVLPSDGGMFAVDAELGAEKWYAPDPVQFVSASPERVYALDQRGRLVTLDAKTGARIGLLRLPEGCQAVANRRSDRLFLHSPDGLVQCLHESQLANPHLHLPPTNGAAPMPAAPGEAAPADDAEAPMEDPDADGANPFM